jgi:hypothetical protein
MAPRVPPLTMDPIAPLDSPPAPEASPAPAVPDPSRPADAGPQAAPPAAARRPPSDRDRPRSLVTRIDLNLSCSRIALLTADGPPYRGDVATDLLPGTYWLTVDRKRKLWVFEARQVRSGLRFTIELDGPDPFSLDYAEPLMLRVYPGIAPSGEDALAAIVESLRQKVVDRTFDRALESLCRLNQVDLYDVLDELWAVDPGTLNEILLHFVEASRSTDVPGQMGVVRALESFARPPKEVYVDAFDRCVIHPDSFKRDDERNDAGLSTVQLYLTFDLIPPRALVLYADDVSDDPAPPKALPAYGPNGLTFPSALSRGTTPHLHAAKAAVKADLERQNADFIVESFRQVANVLLATYQSALQVAKLANARAARAPRRTDRGPGEWQPDAQLERNMTPEAARYQSTACNAPRGMGYYVGGRQFDGFVSRTRTLLDAKLWGRNGRQIGAVSRGSHSVANSIIDRALEQVEVAQRVGCTVEWRMSDPQSVEVVRALFRINRVPIVVVHIPPI